MVRRLTFITLAAILAMGGLLLGRAVGAPRHAPAALPAEPMPKHEFPSLPPPPKAAPAPKNAESAANPDALTPQDLNPSLPAGEPGWLPVKLYFAKASAAQADCAVVTPAARTVPPGSQVYREAVEALLKGPSVEEKSLGMASMFAEGTVLKSVAADAGGTVTVEFNDTFTRAMAGECRTMAVKAQLVSTLRQFPEVHEVVVLAGGKPVFTGK